MNIRMPVMDGHVAKPIEPNKLYSELIGVFSV